MNDLILQPVILMGLLSFVMMLWMYATRIPASKEIEKKGVNLQDLSHPSKLGGVFPSKVERVADNYNHLFVPFTDAFLPLDESSKVLIKCFLGILQL